MSISYSPLINRNGLVMYLDAANSRSYSGSGTTWTDLSGNGNHGTLVNSPTFGSEFGGSMTFTGPANPQYVTTTYNLGNTFTISMVVKSANYSTGWLVHWANDFFNNSTGYWGFISANNTIEFGNVTATYSTNNLSYSSFSPTSVNVCDYVASGGTAYLFYVNGNLVASKLGATYTSSSSNGLYFAARHGNANSGITDSLNGTIYSARVYNRALSSVEIFNNFNTIRGRFKI